MRVLRLVLAAAVSTALIGTALTTPAAASPAEERSWIVEVAPGSHDGVRAALEDFGAEPETEFEGVLEGFSVTLDDAAAADLAGAPGVEAVLPNNPVSVAEPIRHGAEPIRKPGQVRAAGETWVWGLDRIDQMRLPLDGYYRESPSAGSGVLVYVLDTGVATTQSDLPRVERGFSAFGGAATDDCDGHGTHVAGTIASKTFGVAEGATIVPVRILDCEGRGDTGTTLAGLDWILANHPAGTPGVINMSLTSEAPDAAIDEAVNRMSGAGFFVVAAAGNDGIDACETSPARAPGVYAVGATDWDDVRPGFSNWGGCLDVFAPGAEIWSLDVEAGYAALMSGTSMATPHVAGAAAVYLGQHPDATPDEVEAALDAAASGQVTDAGDRSPTRVLTMGASLTPGSPRGVTATAQSSSSVSLSWSAPPTGLVAPTGYTVEVRRPGGSWQVGATTTRTSATVTTGVPATGAYDVRVTAKVGQFAGQPSNVLALTSGPRPAPAPVPELRYGFFLNDAWTTRANHVFQYGRVTDDVLLGDWDGDGVDTVLVRRNNAYYVNNRLGGGEAEYAYVYGRADDVVLVGDWDGDGVDTLAVRRGNVYHVKNEPDFGPADETIVYGRPDDVVLVGDWDGDGVDTLAVRRGSAYHVKNSISSGVADTVVAYGRAGDQVVVGDWDADHRDTLAVRRGNVYHVKNSLTGGPADRVLVYGRANDVVLVGDWNGDGADTLGVRRLP